MSGIKWRSEPSNEALYVLYTTLDFSNDRREDRRRELGYKIPCHLFQYSTYDSYSRCSDHQSIINCSSVFTEPLLLCGKNLSTESCLKREEGKVGGNPVHQKRQTRLTPQIIVLNEPCHHQRRNLQIQFFRERGEVEKFSVCGRKKRKKIFFRA